MNDARFADIVGKLFAYAVAGDGSVSPAEIDVMSRYITKTFPGDAGSRIFGAFQTSVRQTVRLDDLDAAVREHFGEDYRARLELALRIYELIEADGVVEAELRVFDAMSVLFGITPEDADLIRSLAIDTYVYAHPQNDERKISLHDDAEIADVRIPGTDAELIALGPLVVLSNKRSTAVITVAGKQLEPRQLEPLVDGTHVAIGGRELTAAHARRLLELHAIGTRRSVFLRRDGRRLLVCSAEDGQLRLLQEGASISLTDVATGRKLAPVVSGGSATPTDLLPGDRVEIDPDLVIPVELLLREQDAYTVPTVSEPNVVRVGGDHDRADLVAGDRRSLVAARFETSADGAARCVLVNEGARSFRTAAGATVEPGARLEIADETVILFDEERVRVRPADTTVEVIDAVFDHLEVRDLFYTHPGGAVGVDHASFEVRSGELVAVMGASGAGKTTLFRLLLGMDRPRAGEILMNGTPLGQAIASRKDRLGFVPQDDLLIETLSVEQNLRYALGIKAPGLPKAEADRRVEQILHTLGLHERRRLQVGSPTRKTLSGGQRKRLNIGLELLTSPDLFLLDEPTSGLSSRDADGVVRLLRAMANEGKMVVAILHQPSPEIFSLFDRSLILDTGGRLAFSGTPTGCIDYFTEFLPVKDRGDRLDPDVIFRALERPAQVDGGDGRRVRRFPPEYWKNLWEVRRRELPDRDRSATGGDALTDLTVRRQTPFLTRISNRARRTWTLTVRSFIASAQDRGSLVMGVGLPLVLALLMGVLFRGSLEPYSIVRNPQVPKFLFLSAVVLTFFGFVGGIGAVVKDRTLLLRESLLDVGKLQYVTGKMLGYLPTAFVQTLLYLVPAFLVLGLLPGYPQAVRELVGVTPLPAVLGIGFVSVVASYATALFISTFLRSTTAAFNLVPILVIPQIVLGGAMLAYDELPSVVTDSIPLYGSATISRWSYEGFLDAIVSRNPVATLRDPQWAITTGTTAEERRALRSAARETTAELRRLRPRGLPQRFTSEEWDERVDEPVAEFYPHLEEAVESAYERTDEGYRLVSASDDAAAALSELDVWNGLDLYGPNEDAESLFSDAQDGAWWDLIDRVERGDAPAGAWRRNVFPSSRKVLFGRVVPTTAGNAAVMLIFAVGFLAAAAMKLRLERR